MCTNCNEITIPTGAPGAPGTNGTNGTNGAPGVKGDTGLTGANGQNGTNGTTILATYNNITGVGTPASLVETTLFTYTMPANTLANNGDELELFTYYEYTSATLVSLRIKLGSKIISYSLSDSNNFTETLKIKISRISTNSQLWTIERGNTGHSINPPVVYSINTSIVDLSTILLFEITGQNTVTTANQLVLKKATLYKYTA